MTEPTAPNYKSTLNLPKTNFDMKANLTQREPAMLANWQSENLYQKIRTARKSPDPAKKWILHDGPPYANGDIHMGHLINKVLKDIVVKFRTMQGLDSPYVPGWDCHGLPIESAIQKELGPKFRELSKDEVRQRCRDYALKYVKLQGDSFQRLGILGDFDHPYLTLDPKYESGILDVLAQLVSKDLVYRQKKPVHWCTNDRTALAEAELEYQNKKDTSIYVLFRLTERNFLFTKQPAGNETFDLPKETPIDLMIWTTTPWTLPANRAVAANLESQYVLVQYNSGIQYAILAEQLYKKVFATAGKSDFKAIGYVHGETLARATPWYRHPLDDREQPLITASFVTMEDGTGLVHIAPGHGKEDYSVRGAISAAHNMRTISMERYGLQQPEDAIYNPVLPDGRYDDTVPEFLRGKSIWDANDLVLQKLTENETLFYAQKFDHEYPHCWRCKKPVIFRATEQWFVKASVGEDPSTVLRPSDEDLAKYPLIGQALRWAGWDNTVEFIPEWGRTRLLGMLSTRPDWCISRQRSWGVPIPAFFDEQGNILFTAKSIAHIAAYFKQHGADSWYTHTPAQILGTATWTDTIIKSDGSTTDHWPLTTDHLSKGLDILDVWFESGASHHAVLECTHPELGYPANMYLEGSDQHRGWFQSSLLEAAGYKSQPPFRQVLTHGFVVDEKGLKYSKSSGNYVPVDKLLQQHGADVLRLWVASVDYQNDIKFSAPLLTQTSDAYRKIRNTIRYLLGNLYDFNPQTNSVASDPHSIDAWMDMRLKIISLAVENYYDEYEFHGIFRAIYEFCNVDVSAIYAKAIKDRLYCELPNNPKRRASQTMCYRILIRLIELLAPIIAFTSEEAWLTARQLWPNNLAESSVHLRRVNIFSDFQKDVPSTTFDAIMRSQDDGNITDAMKYLRLTLAGSDKAINEQCFTAGKHWHYIMPLIEMGNHQLDQLKHQTGLGNPLDAEAVITVPKTGDALDMTVSDLFEPKYREELEDALGVGFSSVQRGEKFGIKINDTRENPKYKSCARSWKRRPDVGSNPAYPDLSARDAAVVQALRK
jgi:isoleucyl-tRNA synthetase